MIRWCNGENVMVKTSHALENLTLRFIREASNTKQIELIDKTGALYYTTKDMVRIIIPKGLDPKRMKGLMIVGPEDLYFQEIKIIEKKQIKYIENTDRRKRAKENAYKRA